MESLRKFKESTTVQQFKEAIMTAALSEQSKLVENSFAACETGVVLHIKNLYADLNLTNLDKLVRYIFADNQQLLSNLDIKSGSILLSWQAPRATISKLAEQIEEKASLMQTIGIAPVKIGTREYPAIDFCDYDSFEVALLNAVVEGKTEAVKFLLDMGADPNAMTAQGEAALVLASSLGKTECVEYLLQWKADVNRCDELQKTALFCACQNGHMRVTQILLTSGSDVDRYAQDSEGHTALTAACLNNHTDIIDFLVSTSDTDCNRQSVSMSFPNTNMEPNLTGYGGWTGLMVASFLGNIEVVKLLIKLGALINVQDELGCTALIYASIGNHLETVELLLKSGANLVIHDDKNWSAITHANTRKHKGVVEILLTHQYQMDPEFDQDEMIMDEDMVMDNSASHILKLSNQL